MKDIFSVEETNLMCIFDTKDKAALLAELQESLTYIDDPDMRDIYESTISKLESISDEDFSGAGFYIADDYTDDGEV
jgi:hypothetical protein